MQVLFLTVSCFFHFPVIIESAQLQCRDCMYIVPPNQQIGLFQSEFTRSSERPVAKVRDFPRPHILRKVVHVQVLHHCKSKNFSRTSATRYPPPDTFYVMGGKLAHINDFSNLGHGGHPIWGQAG